MADVKHQEIEKDALTYTSHILEFSKNFTHVLGNAVFAAYALLRYSRASSLKYSLEAYLIANNLCYTALTRNQSKL